jgi:AraC family transcriptional regulator
MEERIAAINAALDFIEQHLREDIRVEDMAACCGYSLFHFIRLFNQCVHHTPYDYLIRRRLAGTVDELLRTHRRLIDIAVDYRFQNAETFSRVFNRVFGLQPSRARRQGWLDRRLILQRCNLALMRHYLKFGIPHASRTAEAERWLAGLPMEGDISLVKMKEIQEQLKLPFSITSHCYWVRTYPLDGSQAEPANFAGVEIADPTGLPAHLFARRLPAGDWAVFAGQGLLENVHFTRAYIYQTWTANTGEKIGSPLEVGCFSEGGKSDSFTISLPVSDSTSR